MDSPGERIQISYVDEQSGDIDAVVVMGEASETPSIPQVPFSLWINTTARQHQQEGKEPETTLLEQIKYAKELYDVSQRQEGESDIDEETILSNLQSSPLHRPLVSPLMGISVDWLLDVFPQLAVCGKVIRH